MLDETAMRHDDLSSNGEADPRPLRFGGLEEFEDVDAFRHAGTAVLDRDTTFSAVRRRGAGSSSRGGALARGAPVRNYRGKAANGEGSNSPYACTRPLAIS